VKLADRPLVNARGLLLLALAVCSGCGPSTPRESVLLIVVDTLRRDRLGCYGSAEASTPHIDALAAESLRFTAAQSQAPWTTPSIGSLFTSAWPSQIGIVDEGSVLPAERETLAELVQAAEWRTGAVVSHTFCSSRWQFDQGFDVFDESSIGPVDALTGGSVTDRALEFLDAAGDEPFFLWLHYFDPHWAYVLRDEYARPGVAESFPDPLTPADRALIERHYDSEVAATDAQLGRVFEKLRALGRWETTTIVFTADHGEEFFDHGDLGHTRSLYDELVGVPLLVKSSALEPGLSTDPVALVDVAPTILDSLHLDTPAEWVGRSLLRAPAEDRLIFSETRRQGDLRSVRRGPYKLIRDVSTGRQALFDLRADPGERENLLNAFPSVSHNLSAALDAWRTEYEVEGTGARLDLDAEDQARLRDLGYVEGAGD